MLSRGNLNLIHILLMALVNVYCSVDVIDPRSL